MQNFPIVVISWDVIFVVLSWCLLVTCAILHFYNVSSFSVPCSILQALSKRIHYGKFVAEAKFQESPEAYMPAIIAQVCASVSTLVFLVLLFSTKKNRVSEQNDSSSHLKNCLFLITFCKIQDRDQLMTLLTFENVERLIQERVETKAKIFGQEVNIGAEDNGSPPVYKFTPSLVAELYGRRIMPLTKEVQIAYLLRRLDWVRLYSCKLLDPNSWH